MNKNSIREFYGVFLSNLLLFLSGVMVGFLIPKILGVEDYGYYKTFTLYAAYINLFSFGISEGIYLKYSGTKYDSLNKYTIRGYTILFIKLQLFISLFLLLFSIFFLNRNNMIIGMFISLYSFELNITVYYQYIAQMTMRFKDYSIRNILKSMLTVIAVLIMCLLFYLNKYQSISYTIYISFVLIISTILLFIYIFKFKDITFGVREEVLSDIREILILGVPYLIASLCSILILNIDKQFVSILFNKSIYGVYSFAYNLLSLVTVCTSALSTVIYPKMKQAGIQNIGNSYPILNGYVLNFVYLMLIFFFPISYLIKIFLPQYINSIEIFRIIFPGLAFSSSISVVFQNYFKLTNKNFSFFIINIFILAISIVANLIAYIFFKVPIAISWASIIVLFIYYLLSEGYLRIKYGGHSLKNIIYILVMTCIFYICTKFNLFIGCLLYMILYICMYGIFRKK